MKTLELSTCFITTDIDACRAFYERHFQARVVFDCGWFVNLRLGGDGPSIQFLSPREGLPAFGGVGVMLNCKVPDVDSEYQRLTGEGLTVAMPLEDHPWGDRGFSVLDPLGNHFYIYSQRALSEAYKQYGEG